jgi:hypothetical protein
MKQENYLRIILMYSMLTVVSAWGQLSITSTGTNFKIDFETTLLGVNNSQFKGSGFNISPGSGLLDGNAWRTTGFGTNQAFDANCILDDCARGINTGAISTGGIYALQVGGASDVAFGVIPTENDFTSGTITLKILNNTGVTVTSINVSFEVWVLNSKTRANSFNFKHSDDDITYSDFSALNLTSIEAADGFPVWVENFKATTITGLNITNGSHYYIQWEGNDVSGNGFRDRFGLDDISVKMFSNTWAGSTDSVWTTGANWETGSTPGITDDVVIPSGLTNYPTTSGPVTVNSVTMGSGSSLVTTATFSGAVTYNRTLATTNWNLISSPVTGQTIVDFYSNEAPALGSGTGNDQNIGISYYDNSQALSTNKWNYYKEGQVDGADGDDTTDTFTPSVGYSVKMQAAGDVSFTGAINTGTVIYGLTQGTSSSGTDFNLIGNPYAAYLDSDAFLTQEGITNSNLTSATLWLWNQVSEVYETKIAVDNFKIAPGQGFFVEANTNGHLEFKQSMQSHSASETFLRNSRPEVHLFMNDASNNSFLKVYYVAAATTGFDNGYDGELFGGIPQPFAVYSHLVAENKGKNYQIQSLPNSDLESMVIPIGVKATSGKEVTFSAKALNLPTNIKVFLEDRKTNSFTRLDEENSNYKVTLTETLNDVGRFYLHTTQGSLSSKDVALENISIFKTTAATLRLTGLPQGSTSISLYSISGKKVYTTSFETNGVKDINLPKVVTGVYIVKVNIATGEMNKKIVLE